MKIITRVGEWLLPHWLRAELRPVLAVTGAGAALCTGSVVLAVRGWAWLGERLNVGERLGALTAGGYLTVYGCVHAPQIVRFVIPAALIAWCVAAWWAAPSAAPQSSDEPAAAPDPQDVADLVRDLIGDDRGVLLTALRAPLHAADTRAVRELLATAGIPVRAGVRTADGNGPGVHRKDVPAPPPAEETPSADVVAAGESTNTNTNNTLKVEHQEGMTIIRDRANRHPAHSPTKGP